MARILAEFHRLHGKARTVMETIVYGLVASVAAVAFQMVVNWVYARCYTVPAAGNFWNFALLSLCVIVVASLMAGWMMFSFCPDAAGSGIPQVKLRFWKEFGASAPRIAFVKFLAGAG